MKVLNDNFAPTEISFTLKKVDWTVNRPWADGLEAYEMKQALRKGDCKALNLYYMANLGGSGICYYPVPKPSPVSVAHHINYGCTISAKATPGHTGPHGLGKTTTHEVGHWFGLFHTFEDGCTAPGDFVDDTRTKGSRHRDVCQ